MNQFVHVISGLAAAGPLHTDILKVLAVFGGAGTLFLALFSLQLLLIHHVEQRRNQR